jgi:hypothetical protein
MSQLLGKKPANYEDATNQLIDQNDISMTLQGSEEEKNKVIRDLEKWYIENS